MYRNDNDENDYAEEEGRHRHAQAFRRSLICNDPFYPDTYHEDDMRADIVDISEEVSEC